jgi:MoaA/NifB/PqqE/SkfB family radical SAM enzyme
MLEFRALSQSLGRVENLNLSGGEPFLRKEFAEICRLFIRNNGVKQIYVPTNGSFRNRTLDAIRGVLGERDLQLFVAEISLDGMPEFHNRFRGMKDAFERAMDTYDGLAELQRQDPRVRVHSISTVTGTNVAEIRRLTEYLFERCPAMDHHNLALIRGDRKNPSLTGPVLEEYRRLYAHVRELWRSREEGRFGAIVEPMLQCAKMRTAKERRQVVPCLAGRLSAVIYANGDVSFCETHAPLGNLRQQSFQEIWNSEPARQLRVSIQSKECWCTNEVFLWPSIVFQPTHLVRTLVESRPWSRGVSQVSGSPKPTGAGPTTLRVLE